MCSEDWWIVCSNWLQKQSGKEYERQLADHLKRRRARSTFRYNPPQWIRDCCEALGKNDEAGFKRISLQVNLGHIDPEMR